MFQRLRPDAPIGAMDKGQGLEGGEILKRRSGTLAEGTEILRLHRVHPPMLLAQQTVQGQAAAGIVDLRRGTQGLAVLRIPRG